MKIAVLGGGSYLAKAYIRKWQESFEFAVFQRGKNLTDYFELTSQDLKGCDTAINFTAIVHQKGVRESLYRRVNVELALHLAKIAKEAGVSHFIQLSTIAVYGKQTSIDHHTLPDPGTPYAKTKLQADNKLSAMAESDFLITTVRPAMVYGKGAPGNFAKLVRLLRLPMPLPFGYDKNKRAMLFVEHFGEALRRVVERKVQGVLLLRDQKEPSLKELSVTIREALGVQTAVFSPPCFMVDAAMATSLGFKLFGTLHIDDGDTIERLGEYRTFSMEESIRKAI